MRVATIFIAVYCLLSCSAPEEGKKSYQEELKMYRMKRNKELLKGKSPIPEEEKKAFAGLNYFIGNVSYRVNAKFSLLANQQSFKMKTNTDRTPLYIPYAKLEFIINDTLCNLTAYKNLEYNDNELFVPFTDNTNGLETYPTGRYLDIEIPDSDTIVLDFNRCYNPYCAYNKKYSCPIPPSENNLNVSIRAGERLYHQ